MRSNKKKTVRNVGSEPGPKSPLGLRVIGGKLRGSKLKYTGDNRVRPMKDRTREAVFNLISTDSKEAHVIDLFSGTGALAIEAVSRGAVSAVLVEVHLQTLRNLRQNVEELRLQEQCPLVQADAFFFVKAMDRKYFPADRRWLVFCSPPYDFYKSQLAEMTGMLTTLYTAAPVNSAFVVEAETSFDFDLLQFPDADARFRAYPPAKIGVYRKTNTLGNGSPV